MHLFVDCSIYLFIYFFIYRFVYSIINSLIYLSVTFHLQFFSTVISAEIRINDVIQNFITRDSIKKGFENLRLLSICSDDFCLGKNNEKSKQKEKNNNNVNHSHWVRCLIVIEKVDINYPKKNKNNNLGTEEYEIKKKYRAYDDSALDNNSKCLPFIFDSVNKCKNNDSINNDNNNCNRITEDSIDNILFLGFQKEVFSAAWRGGKRN